MDLFSKASLGRLVGILYLGVSWAFFGRMFTIWAALRGFLHILNFAVGKCLNSGSVVFFLQHDPSLAFWRSELSNFLFSAGYILRTLCKFAGCDGLRSTAYRPYLPS